VSFDPSGRRDAEFTAMVRRVLKDYRWLVLALAGLWAGRDSAGSESADLAAFEFVKQLQQRQLHRLAEVYCRQKLEDAEEADSDPTPWVLGLLDALAGQALADDDLMDSTFWDEADELAAKYQRQRSGTRPGGEIALRRQLVQLARANAYLLAAELDADPEPRRQRTRGILRTASRSLKELDDEVAQLLRSPSTRDNPDESRALQALQQQIQFAMGSVFLRHAHAYADRSPDRVHLLTEALRTFTALARTMPSSELTLEGRLREVECLRHLHSFEVAHQRLAQFPTEGLSRTIRQQLVLQQARLDIDQGNLQQAVQRLLAGQQQNLQDDDSRRSGELMLAMVEAYLELAKQDGATSESAESQQWHNMALDVIRQMEQHVSTYWVRRAESLLTLQPADAAGMAELEIMTRSADNFYRRKQYEESLVAYQRAAQLAAELELPARQFTLGMRAAAVQHQLGRYRPASDAFRQLAIRFLQHEQAAQAHWLAITSEAELVRADPQLIASYQQLLEQHLQTWPQSQWADEARFWLGRLLLQQNDVTAARRYWQAIDPISERFAQAMKELSGHYHRRLSDPANLQPDDQRRLANEAIAACRQWQSAIRNQIREESEPAEDATLSIAEFGLLYADMPVTEAQRLIDSARRDEATYTAFSDRVSALEGLIQAISTEYTKAKASWQSVAWDSYELALPLARRLHGELRSTSQAGGHVEELAQLQRRLVERLLATTRGRDNAQLKTWEAVALAATGERAKAIEQLERLAENSPRDVTLQQLLGELLEAGSDAAEHRRALDHWRRVVRLTPDASNLWFRAKLGIAHGLLQLGDRQRAAEMIGILETLHPELGGPAMKAEFQRLKSQLGKP
jgi:hypothetical protein